MDQGTAKQNKKALLVLTPGFPADETDSTCLPAQQIFIKALNSRFNSIGIIILSFQYPFTNSNYQWNGNTVIPLNGRNKNKLSRLITWLRVWNKIKGINKEYELIGLLSFWCTECALLGKYFGKVYKLRHYCWILGQDARKQNGFVRWIKPDKGNLIAMSGFLAEEYHSNHGIRPGHIIPNGIDISEFPLGKKERDIDILGVGSLIPLKQFEIFISVIKELTADFPGIRTLICGKGPDKQKLEAIIKCRQLQNNITLAGEKPHPEILGLMSRAKILLHPSSYEGFSTVCLESLYAGAHVISFCNPMMGEIKKWHIVKNKEEMVKIVSKILSGDSPDHHPVMPFSMIQSAEEIMKLYLSSSIDPRQ